MRDAAAILFDYGGTLDAPGVPWKERFRRHHVEEGFDVPAERFDRAFYDAGDSMIGTVGAELDLTGLVREMSMRLARNLSLESDPRSVRVGERFLAEARLRLAESVALFERLSQRYKLGIVSNFYGNLGAVCREVGLDRYSGILVDSTLVGCLKPDPRIFQAALDALGVRAEQTVFVGDSRPRDMAGARGMGMRHVLLGPAVGDLCCPGDLRIDSLGELAHKFL